LTDLRNQREADKEQVKRVRSAVKGKAMIRPSTRWWAEPGAASADKPGRVCLEAASAFGRLVNPKWLRNAPFGVLCWQAPG